MYIIYKLYVYTGNGNVVLGSWIT